MRLYSILLSNPNETTDQKNRVRPVVKRHFEQYNAEMGKELAIWIGFSVSMQYQRLRMQSDVIYIYIYMCVEPE